MKIEVFEAFGLSFLSQLTFKLKKKSFSLDDNILYEDEIGNEIFFLTAGTVAIYHKRTWSFVKELLVSYIRLFNLFSQKDSYLGEISFFTGLPRICSAKCRDFTDTLTLLSEDFWEVAYNFQDVIVILSIIFSI
jgi:CRP-like cAMP-binding protein